jgi:hypothetical protein
LWPQISPNTAAAAFFLLVTTSAVGLGQTGTGSLADALAALVRAYPDFLDRIEDNDPGSLADCRRQARRARDAIDMDRVCPNRRPKRAG